MLRSCSGGRRDGRLASGGDAAVAAPRRRRDGAASRGAKPVAKPVYATLRSALTRVKRRGPVTRPTRPGSPPGRLGYDGEADDRPCPGDAWRHPPLPALRLPDPGRDRVEPA